jgi:hypothetical protein
LKKKNDAPAAETDRPMMVPGQDETQEVGPTNENEEQKVEDPDAV